MNFTILTGIAAFAFIFTGCKKDPDKGLYFGSATATLNGKAWKAGKVRCGINIPCYKGKLGFDFIVFNQEGFKRESLSFGKIPIAKGTYSVNPQNYNDLVCRDTVALGGYSTSQDEGDVALDYYNPIASANNYFTITNYNERTKELWGSFAVSFKISTRRDPNSPDTIRVTNGNFYTKIL